jgi:hypothetical protein
MKYLLFNVAVAAALVFLFTADRGEVQKIAGQVHDAAGDMKDYANKMLRTSQDQPVRDAVKTERKPQPAPLLPAATPSATPSATRPEPPSEPPSQPAIPRQLAKPIPAIPEIGSETSKTAAVDLNPEIARRRQEVLDGIDTASAVDGAPALKEGTHLMTASQRRKELLSLAEEMELLYARSISR